MLATLARAPAFGALSSRPIASSFLAPTFLSRYFSSTPAAAKYKLKSHSGAKKRWKALASGVFKRAHAGHQHLNVSKPPGRKNRLGNTAYSHGSQTSKLKKLLPWA